MIRFLILFAVGYAVYRIAKSWRLPPASPSKPEAGPGASPAADVMVKDPFCGTYFAKRNAVHVNYRGKDLYFCSTRCRDEYLAARGENKP